MKYFSELRIANYRSINGEGIRIKNIGKANLFIGKNNSGKSNILRFISTLKQTFHTKEFRLSEVDLFQKDSDQPIICEFVIDARGLGELFFDLTQQEIDSFYSQHRSQNINPSDVEIVFPLTIRNTGYEWPEVAAKPFTDFSLRMGNIWVALKNRQSSRVTMETLWNEIATKFIQYVTTKFKNVFLIDEFRRIDPDDKSKVPEDGSREQRLFNGKGLIVELNRLKNPNAANQKDRDKFNRIQNFARSITNDPTLTIEVSHDLELSIMSNDLQLPINNYGTGIHQLILMASSFVVNSGCVFCIEEPELFLHPEVQKKLLRFILTTKNDYFISTHSASFLNEETVGVFHVQRKGGFSTCTSVISPNEKFEILTDLGYRPSDLLQTNFLLWVEGPSDRIYINKWINTIDPTLREGIDYSVMFYGGRLLSHLSYDNQEIEDFIRLNRIAVNAGIVMDSDIKDPQTTINKTKARIQQEFIGQDKFVWVTEGREIENYIHEEDFTKVSPIHCTSNQFLKRTEYLFNTEKKTLDKVKLAREYSRIADVKIEVLDLKDQITSLINRIRLVNSH